MFILKRGNGSRVPAWVTGILVVMGLSLRVSPGLALPGNVENGKTLYQQRCSTCHGVDGRGGSMASMLPVPRRDLTQANYMGTRSDEDLFRAIHDGGPAVGRSSAMPAFASQLRQQDIWDTVAYVRTLATAQGLAPPASPPSQTELVMTRLRMLIWPEYDDPRLRIIMRGELALAQAFPTTLTLPIPKGAEIIGAGMITERNELLLHPHEVLPGDGTDSIAMKLPVPRFFLEFYYSPFSPEQANKRFTYAVPSGYAITLLEVDVQAPLQATNFVTDPAAMEQGSDQQGFQHAGFTYRDLPVGAAPQFTVTYTRTATAPSVTKPETPKPAASLPSPALLRRHTLQIALSMLAGATVFFVSMLWWWRRRERLHANAGLTAAPQELPPLPPPVAGQGGPHNFCTQCGTPLDPAYRFCARCGQAVPT